MTNLPFLEAAKIEELHDYPALINELQLALKENQIVYPLRQHYSYGEENTLLTMPSWQDGRDIGIKLVTVTPSNKNNNLPSIQGVVVYFDAQTGRPLALLDAAAITRKRTAAASALASKLLSRPDSSSLLVLGTGALAPELVKAHLAVRPIKQVYIWGRTFGKAKSVAEALRGEAISVQAIERITDVASSMSIISTATMAMTPLLTGAHLALGQHFDLVGSYKPDMREVNDEVISQAQIYVDNKVGALHESGDLCIPLANGVITEADIRGELFELCQQAVSGRENEEQITLFKSVGFALEDLVAARFYYERYLASRP